MPAAAAPPPSTPPAAPAKPAAAAAPSAPAPVTNPFDQSFADLERFTHEGELPGREPETPAKPAARTKPEKPAVSGKTPAKPAAQSKPAAKPAPAAPAAKVDGSEGLADPEAEEPTTPEGEGTPAPEDTTPPAKPDGKRPSPWTLLDQFKARAIRAEKELQEARSAQKSGELPKEHIERFSTLEARNKELEEEIRHVNYAKSKDFEETYKKPYEHAWRRALSELSELTVTNADGSTRQATSADMLRLANMPLGEAWDQAEEWFGKAASAVMNHRDKLKDLSDKQSTALEDARKNGGDREKQLTLEQQARELTNRKNMAKLWEDANREITEKYEYLRPIEGETERNEKLERAIKFIDETFHLNANQAKTEEERQQIIRRHAALRSRAIGFTVLNYENKALRAEIETLKKSLEEFQGSEPTNGEPRRTENGEGFADTMEGALAGLAKLAS